MSRIRLAGPALAGLAWTPGQQVRVLVSDLFSFETVRHAFRDALRTYSVWDHDAVAATLDLCVLEHGEGPAPAGRKALRSGTKWPSVRPRETSCCTAGLPRLPRRGDGFGGLRRDAADGPGERRVFGAIEVDAEATGLSLPRGDELSWHYREGRPAENSAGLLAAARALELPQTPGFLYLAGEAKTCAAIRRHFIDDRGWPAKTSMTVKPFWTPGKRGLE